MIEFSHKTKIVATMGPATASAEVLEAMFTAGLDICRINFSHGNYDAVKAIVENIRAANKKLNRHVGILADLQGPKLRIGEVENNAIELVNGEEITITPKEGIATSQSVYITYPQFPKDVKKDELVLI